MHCLPISPSKNACDLDDWPVKVLGPLHSKALGSCQRLYKSHLLSPSEGYSMHNQCKGASLMGSNSPLGKILGCFMKGLESSVMHMLPAVLSGPSIKDTKNMVLSVDKKRGVAATNRSAYTGPFN
jgi:hypothetical protein